MRPDRLFEGYHIWVLAPSIQSDDPNINYYYDFTQSINEYTKVFEELNLPWTWQPIRLDNFKDIIRNIASSTNQNKVLVMNLCDGDEVNQAPGISIIRELENQNLSYTGSKEFFYAVTTSKIPMKREFDYHRVNTPRWEVIAQDRSNVKDIFHRISTPIIVKPAVSGGSMGLGVANVVENEMECHKILDKIQDGYRGWNLTVDGVFAEEFIEGREFTTLLVGSYNRPDEIIYYQPVERVFNKNLPAKEQILSFDRLWETYDEEDSLGEDQFLFNYYSPESTLNETLKTLSLQAYTALKGTGYTRIDIRMDERSGQCYVLEANAQCGLSEDENYTSIGAILRVNNKSFTDLIAEILNDAIKRRVS